MKLFLIFAVLSLSCLFGICQATDAPEYLPYFDPAKGFKPAQANLTEIFLQIAGSLEATGSPESYLRHMQAEHRSIADRFKAKTGHELQSHWPGQMTDGYIDHLVNNWKLLASALPLDDLTKSAGIYARKAIHGTRGNGTILISIFNAHQDEVVKTMQGKGQDSSFERLRSTLALELQLASQKPVINHTKQSLALIAEREKALTTNEREEYANLLKHQRITKPEFAELEHFYSHGYDKLSEAGKDEMSRRIWSGMRSTKPDDIQDDAVSSAQSFRSEEGQFFKKIDAALGPEKASQLEAAINGVFIDLGRLAQAELELAILESALK